MSLQPDFLARVVVGYSSWSLPGNLLGCKAGHTILEFCVRHVPLQAGFCMLAGDHNLLLDAMAVTQFICH